ncbi:uncharacterized protein LOC131952414 isoform X2 [Physella acuta]|uniref:uncharacterized protein LOC131952414 isoform X2 n=1 Tax=Physella acuta TaxID=109671 RepID=UPI0027DC5343|nr:uncharacterized protein LOC131952414 isoform X2 [Physella acuta]
MSRSTTRRCRQMSSDIEEGRLALPDCIKLEDGADEDGMDSLDDSEDDGLLIDDMQEVKDTDEAEKDSEDDDQNQLVFNGTMTRRQSRQFKDAGNSFAVFSVRSPASKPNKTRTCEYCHVVKATPAALIRHLRKHTGERPFVCQCGKAYKAKRSLHLHQSTHHREIPVTPPVQPAAPTSTPLTAAVIQQLSATPAVSESTKSLLRETLESSRKAKDGSTGCQTPELTPTSSVRPELTPTGRIIERLSAPNLVTLLTSDCTKNVSPTEDVGKGVNCLAKLHPDVNTNYLLSPALVKVERDQDLLALSVKEEEQAEDLSMASKRAARPTPEKRLKCDFCNKSFKHEISRANHTRTAHGIVINFNPLQHGLFSLLDSKPSSNITQTLPHTTQEPSAIKSDPAADLPFSLLSRQVREATCAEVVKMEMPTVSSDGPVLDESNTLPYHVTSRMVQDFNVEDLRIKDAEKSVLAEDGGNRRLRVTVLRETVLATRLDGINNVTGRRATVFKCHLCLRVFSSLLRFNHHLPSHYDTEVQTYDCRYCEASFRSHVQIVKHLQCHREKFTGVNQAGTALNSAGLLLEDPQRKLKDQHIDLPLSSSSAFSPTFTSDDSSHMISSTEPGERANGGYSCVKCRKSFSREYLLQRHMRIHQNQSTFYCPDCESGFNGEQDLLDHRRLHHGIKSPELMQYTNLLKSLNAGVDPNKKGLQSHVYPLVDMKAFDLRRGQQVEVRMASDVNDKEREETLRRALLQGYQHNKALVMMMAASTKAEDQRKAMQLLEQINTHLLQPSAQQTEQLRQALLNATNVDEWTKRVKLEEELKKREEEEVRQKEEKKKRKMERDKLKQILAKEGMGDVTVVLPDAPPPDEGDVTADQPTDLSAKQPALGFMARKMDSTLASSSLPADKDRTFGMESEQHLASSLKRPQTVLPEHSSGPPSKNRRKANKPQRIQFDRETTQKEKEDKNNNSTSTTFQANKKEPAAPEPPGGVEEKKVIAGSVSQPHTAYTTEAIDLSTENKEKAWSAFTVVNRTASSSPSVSPSPDDQHDSGTKKIKPTISPPALDSENSLSQELTSAADLSKATRQLSIQIPSSVNGSASLPGNFASINSSISLPSDPENLVGCPRVLWKSEYPTPSEISENFLAKGQWNGKGNKTSVPQTPSPAPSPTNSDTSSAEGRKITTTSLSRTHSSARATSLSRTHSRLSVVNEPLDRNSLCKPKVLDDGRSVYSCVICHKNFLSLSDINRHMDFHEDIRPYKCKYCDYYARTNSQLKVHKLRHEGVREFCCRVCNYKGVTQSDLNRHMKSQVHLLRSNHVCAQCGEGFVTPKTLRDHSLSCTGSVDKSFDGVSANDNDDELNDEDYDEEDLMSVEESSQGNQGNGSTVLAEVKVAVM